MAGIRMRFAACLALCALTGAMGSAPARAQDASAALPATAAAQASASVYARELVRRVSRLEPALLTALSSARGGGLVAPARCLDRALSELHSVERQVGYHLERVREAVDDAAERERHLRALTFLSARLDYLAASIERCSSPRAPVRNGTTRVEVVIPSR